MFLQNYGNTSGIENLRALILLKPVRLFYFVHASVTMLMLIPSISASTSAQAPNVAPVVSTSSTSRSHVCLAAYGYRQPDEKDEPCFPAVPARIYGSGSDCFAPDRATRRTPVPVCSEMPSASRRLWLYPLVRRRSGCKGNRQQIIYSLKETPSGAVHAPASLPSAGRLSDGHSISYRPIYGQLSLHGHNKTKPTPAVQETPPENLFHFIARCIS